MERANFSIDGRSTDPMHQQSDHTVIDSQRTRSRPVSQSDVLAFLGKEMSYGLAEPIDRIDTAQSVLFLAGPYCFKLRRHIPLGQPESVSLERRLELASKEMRLGKAFAPDLYLDLVPVMFHQGRLSLLLPEGILDGHRSSKSDMQGQIVEWLVLLNRYDFSKSYDKQVEVHQPNFDECHKLADLIADGFQKDIKRSGFLDPAHTWMDHLKECLDDLKDVSRKLDQETRQTTLRACFNRALQQLERGRPVIQERGKRGLIGSIHGNLRLSNVVELPEGLRMVNPKVSDKNVLVRNWFGDPFYDLASLITEMWSRGLCRQANWVLSHYCNQLMDSPSLDGLQLLDLYLFVQALERAKLQTSRRGENGALSLSEALETNPSLRGYLKTARDCLLQDEATLIVVGGSSQSKRSRFARMLAPLAGRMPGAIYLSAEEEMLALHEVDRAEQLPDVARRGSVWRVVYRRLSDKAHMALAAGYSVILEGRFDKPESRRTLSQLASGIGAQRPIVAFHLFDPHSDLHHRPAVSKHLIAQQDLEPSSEQDLSGIRAPDPISDVDPDWTNWIELDASRAVDDLLNSAKQHINSGLVPEISCEVPAARTLH